MLLAPADVALGLEKVLGGSVSFWATREALYQARIAAQAETDELESHVGWAQQFPIKELKERNLIPRPAHGSTLSRISFDSSGSPTRTNGSIPPSRIARLEQSKATASRCRRGYG
jgi:hypothetical protein